MVHFAQKSWGQNFLQSPEIRDKILFSAGNLKGQNILEIGPGLGFLTTKLLKENPNKCITVEIDPRAIEILKKDFGHKESFQVIEGDILQQDLDTIWKEEPYMVIANIPYNITSPILRKLLSRTKNKPKKTILMVQKEVGLKICNTKKRSVLSLSVEIFAETEYLFHVSRNDFLPIPKVDSGVICLTLRHTPLIPETLQKDFFIVINAGFSQKRKKIGNYIGSFFGVSSQLLLQDIDPNKRAETLSVEEWEKITYNFRKYT